MKKSIAFVVLLAVFHVVIDGSAAEKYVSKIIKFFVLDYNYLKLH